MQPKFSSLTAACDTYRKIRMCAVLGLVLMALTVAVYWQAGNFEFLNLDDNVYITKNSYVAQGITGKNIIWAFTSITSSNWHPVTMLSHMMDVQFYGMNPRGHHLTNIAIHTVTSLLLLFLLLRVTGALWSSAFVAALFALHPLHVESVAWVAERKDVLSAFFGFLTLLFYTEYLARQKPVLYMLSIFSFVTGLMSKPMLVTLPVIMLLMNFWPLNRCWPEGQGHTPSHRFGRVRAFLIEIGPFMACSLLSGIVTIYAQHRGGAIQSLNVLPLWFRIENALIAYVRYMIKTVWPDGLAVMYPMPAEYPLWQVIGSLLMLLLVSMAAIRIRRRHPYVTVGWFWFLITLLPVIGIIQVGTQSMADRYTYIPLVGLFIIVAWGIPELTKGLQCQVAVHILLVVAAITASTLVTWHQVSYWRDSIALYRHTLQVTTGNYLINYNLGVTLAVKGNVDAAITEFREALRINPNFADAHINLGLALLLKGNTDAAIQEYSRALLLNPNSMAAHYNLGNALANKGDVDTAIQEYRKALQINPNYIDAYNNLVRLLAYKRAAVKNH